MSVEELRKAKFKLVSLVQKQSFAVVIKQIQKAGSVNGPSKLRDINPFIDKINGMMRVRGRLRNSNIPYIKRFPMLLPSTHPLTKLIVQPVHSENLHSGVRDTIRKCVTCFKT